MRKIYTLLLTTLTAMAAMCPTLEAKAEDNHVSGVYVGGHIRRERPNTITKLKDSGFTYVILFNVHVDPDGTLKTDGETICKNGEYVFTRTQPYYVDDVKALKTAPTSISRLEICIGGWGNDSYVNIKNLINSKGTGKTTMLYRNFKALLDAVPGIDAVNNDDEHSYDVATATKFHVMMYDLGLKTTLAPYTNKSFWTSLANNVNRQRPGAVDRVMIQCYDGGSGNDPRNWDFGNITRHAGRTNYQTDMNTSIKQMQTWRDNGGATGGFVWVYNDETWDLNAWASAINRTYGARVVKEEDIAAKAYSEKNKGGYCVNLPVGIHTKSDLAVFGIQANDIESFFTMKGYKSKLYTKNDCTGSYFLVGDSVYRATLITNVSNKVNSIKIEAIPPSTDGIESIQQEDIEINLLGDDIYVDNAKGANIEIYNISGQKILSTIVRNDAEVITLKPLPKGTYVVKTKGKTIKIVR